MVEGGPEVVHTVPYESCQASWRHRHYVDAWTVGARST